VTDAGGPIVASQEIKIQERLEFAKKKKQKTEHEVLLNLPPSTLNTMRIIKGHDSLFQLQINL
jgi:hypothetical protein